MSATQQLVVATRLHLGHASDPPTQESLDAKMANFRKFCASSCQTTLGLIAVDATPKIDGYDMVQAVQSACDKLANNGDEAKLHVVPVTPWGKFVPALNALIGFACKYSQTHFDQIFFVSAETTASLEAIQHLRSHMDPDTLVAGAVLAGHDYRGKNQKVHLTGRTSPWNTLAVWNLRKLALTGFALCSDGLLTDHEQAPSFGIEEVAATALLQKLIGPEQARSKLVQVPGIDWQVQQFENDPARQKWHEQKMQSKVDRAARQLELLGLQGTVEHC